MQSRLRRVVAALRRRRRRAAALTALAAALVLLVAGPGSAAARTHHRWGTFFPTSAPPKVGLYERIYLRTPRTVSVIPPAYAVRGRTPHGGLIYSLPLFRFGTDPGVVPTGVYVQRPDGLIRSYSLDGEP